MLVEQERVLAAHEAMELHEALNMKTLGLAKSKLMQGLVFDQELRALLEKDVQQSTAAIHDLRRVYGRARFSAAVPEFRPEPITE